jgi:ectoine hydroxylase-related dioxygenase (phytanoyl-CoA dioxygenase family)
MHQAHSRPDAFVHESATRLAADLGRDGYGIVDEIAQPDDLAALTLVTSEILADAGTKRRELGERGGAPQIVEIERITELKPELLKLDVIQYAKAISAEVLGAPVDMHYDHVIFKPPRNMKETAWHQDFAYGRRLTFSARRLHWWLPLHDVDADQSCMRFVPGSHKSGYLPHRAVAPTSDALMADVPAGAQVITCPLKAGSATVHLPATLHGTGPNQTDRPRTALVLQFAAHSWIPRLVR